MKPDDGLIIDWEITVDQKRGFNSMRTTRRRYITLRLWHAWTIILALCAGAWAGLISLGFWVAEWLK